MDLFIKILLAGLFVILLYEIWTMVRVEVAYKNQMKILDATYEYVCDTKNYEMSMHIMDKMEPMEQTARRWYDFSCKNIVPKVYYEMIEPYIK